MLKGHGQKTRSAWLHVGQAPDAAHVLYLPSELFVQHVVVRGVQVHCPSRMPAGCLFRTPVYMSPELINSRNGAKGYDGKQVDVWASGVLLIVMLLGTFPFDHTENPDPNTSEAHLEVW